MWFMGSLVRDLNFLFLFSEFTRWEITPDLPHTFRTINPTPFACTFLS